MGRDSGFFQQLDELTLERARRGDLGALESVYRAFEAPVFTLARRLCRTDEDASDVLQETFMEVVRSIRSFRGDGAFGAWLRRIAASKALMRLRRTRSRPESGVLPEDLQEQRSREPKGCEHGTASWDHRLDLERALAHLTETARAVVWLHDVEGLTHAEIGDLMGRTPSFSKSQLARAHARLRLWLSLNQGLNHASDDRRAAGLS